jgi:hypothetical protein
VWQVPCIGEKRKEYRTEARKTKGNGPLAKLRIKWNIDINMNLEEMGWKGADWIHLAKDRLW